ncbi:unnamed protein product [Brassicogethes aeneus]|uniref:Uncharacterized protein n=1 Tax=Brassicogethes aeneus TaxID=1431903 RepID=A0A9P0FD49_BRAAE|nr:unnamed protein product [Brassicogethes aeneus]
MPELRRSSGVRDNDVDLVIDGVLSTQPELGPSIPDGGYGWVVFIGSLFFQLLVNSIPVGLGVFLCFTKLEYVTKGDINPKIWDDHFLYAPLFFAISWTISDPFVRTLIQSSTWPRLVATAGTCLTCAGLLFMWMALSGHEQGWIYAISGTISGIGSSLQISQCEILVAQYFKLKHSILLHYSYAVTAIGYILVPIILGDNLLKTNLSNVIMWYQTVLLQGLVVALFFKKPAYLKAKRRTYNFLQTDKEEDEEDIFSKNSKELQIRQHNEIVKKVILNEAGTSNENEEYLEKKKQWETFEDTESMTSRSLKDELAEATSNNNTMPIMPTPLFSDTPVNNNITYSFEDVEADNPEPSVFKANKPTKSIIEIFHLELLKQPTFYKSLLMVVTTKFSKFVFFTLMPSYLYLESQKSFQPIMDFMGIVSIAILLFSGISYWVNVNKQRRPICLWVLSWMGSVGYFFISDLPYESFLKFGALQVVFSIAALDFVGKPLLGLTYRGEQTKEFMLISLLSGKSFLFFLCFDIQLQSCFRLMGILHFSTGCIWFTNFVYKKIKETR